MSIRSVLLVLAMALAYPAQGETVKLYILAGQSNTVGIVDTRQLDPIYTAPNEQVLFDFYIRNGYYASLISEPPGLIPLQHLAQMTLPGNPSLPAFANLYGAQELSLGRALAERLTDKVAILKVGINGSTLGAAFWNTETPNAGWLPSLNSYYAEMMAKVDGTVQKLADIGYTVEIAGFAWGQGETDGSNGLPAEADPTLAPKYGDHLLSFLSGLRQEPIFPSTMPIVVHALHGGANVTHGDLIRAGQRWAVERAEGVTLMNHDDLQLHTDLIHYSADMQIAVGHRLADFFAPRDIGAEFLEWQRTFDGNASTAVPEPSSLVLLPGLVALAWRGRRRRA